MDRYWCCKPQQRLCFPAVVTAANVSDVAVLPDLLHASRRTSNCWNSERPGGEGRTEMSKQRPHDQRRGWLKNGNTPGDFSKAARCGARNRRGTPYKCPAMANGRCRLHRGMSTGPRTREGIERIRQAVT